jgi:4-alpha-methyl-delta7-sterol-4alpha-methyl oxidase
MVSQWLVQWPMLLLAEAVFGYAGLPSLQSPLPSIFTCAWHLTVYLLLCDTLLYWIHRMFHHPLLYARIHKQHHEFKQNVGISSEYFHPLEDFGTGVIPTVTGPLLLARHGGHPLLLAFWIFLRVCESCDAHCGFDFPYSPFRLGRPGDRYQA